jgi:DNA polymerase-3 subunit gamma/tau
MSYLIYARKYRPESFEAVIGQKAIVHTLQNAIKTNRVAQAYIFSGMRGVGKTSLARILAKALNCKEGPTPTPCNTCESCREIKEDRSVDVLEIDGASNRGIDEIRALREAVKYKPLRSRYKIIYIDEVHQITRDGFNALLKTLEEPPPQTVFIFATTEFHKVPATIVSRCQHFEFKKISQKETINHLLKIVKDENIAISDYGLKLIAGAAEGSMRDAQSLLDQAVAFSGLVIHDDDLKEILGVIGRDILFGCSNLILGQDPAGVYRLVEKIMERGHDLRAFYKDLIQHFRNLLLARSVEDVQDLLPLNAEELAALKDEAGKATAEELLRYLHVLQEAESGLRYSSLPEIYLETLLVRLCQFRKIVPLEELIDAVGRLKSEAPPGPGERGDARVAPPASRTKGDIAPKMAPGPAAARPPEPEKPASEKDFWQRMIVELEKEKSSLAAILRREATLRVKDEAADIKFSTDKGFILDNPAVLEIAFAAGDSVFRETVHREARVIERIASEILGRKVRLKLADAAGDREPGREKGMETALKDPAVRAFMDAFRAQILAVEPISRGKEREEA